MNKITTEEIKELMEIKGEVRGQVFTTDFRYIKEAKGEQGIKLLKERLAELGIPIDYEKIETTKWYPLRLRVISLLAIKEVFNFNDKDIENMGRIAPKLSFIVKTLMRTFSSVERSFKETTDYWEKHYSVGRLTPSEIDMKKKHAFFNLKNFKVHPILCLYLMGYFYTIAEFILKSKKITIQETKCPFRGDNYHEFSTKWE
jgi:hypothetical protein